jgi:hypothetical protein
MKKTMRVKIIRSFAEAGRNALRVNDVLNHCPIAVAESLILRGLAVSLEPVEEQKEISSKRRKGEK